MCNDKTERCSSGLGCPCGRNPGPVCNEATATGLYDCTACGCMTPGRVTAASEEVCTEIVSVRLAKTVTPTCARPGAEVLYAIAVRNCSSIPINTLTLTDPLAARYLQVGIIRFNGVRIPGDLTTGVSLPAIGPGGVGVVTFAARPLEGAPSVIENTAYLDYRFVTVCGGETEAQAASNVAALEVLRPGLSITKSVDRCYVTPEEPVLTYTLIARNTGNVALDNVTVTDQLEDRLDYVPNTTRINDGAPQNRSPELGINVGTLAPGGQAEVEFQARLDCDDEE